jgi:hypothetical protein
MKSSKIKVNKMERLKNIQRVQMPDYMYETIVSKIKREKANLIPLHWAGVAAAIVILCISTNIYLVSNNYRSDQKNELENLVPTTTLELYHE